MNDNRKPLSGRSHRRKILATSIAATLLGVPLAQAQQAGVEEISVTGSRVRMTSGMATPVPVTVVTISELNSFNPGASTVEQMSQLPQFFNTLSSQRGSGTLFAQRVAVTSTCVISAPTAR